MTQLYNLALSSPQNNYIFYKNVMTPYKISKLKLDLYWLADFARAKLIYWDEF